MEDTVLYELVAFCVMPNHVHILMRPTGKLAEVMQKLKGGSAKLINKMMGRKGRFWAADYYDKLIRDEKHFSVVYQYIKNNPIMLGEAKASPPRFYGIYENEVETGAGTVSGIGALAPTKNNETL